MLHFHGTDPESIRRRLIEIEEAVEDAREERRALLRTLGLLLFWPAAAIAGMAWGFQMDDLVTGQAVFYLFAAAGNLGILGTLIAAHLRRG